MGSEPSKDEIIRVDFVRVKGETIHLYTIDSYAPLFINCDQEGFDLAYTARFGEYFYKEIVNGKIKISKNFPKYIISGTVKHICPDGRVILDETTRFPLYAPHSSYWNVGTTICVKCDFEDGKYFPLENVPSENGYVPLESPIQNRPVDD